MCATASPRHKAGPSHARRSCAQRPTSCHFSALRAPTVCHRRLRLLMRSRASCTRLRKRCACDTAGGVGLRALTRPSPSLVPCSPLFPTPLLGVQHQAFRAWLRVLQARLVSDGVMGAALVDVGASLPVASFGAAVEALQRAAAAHYYGGKRAAKSRATRPAPDRGGAGSGADVDEESEEKNEEGEDDGVRWWVSACKVLAEYATAVSPVSGATVTHAPAVAAPSSPLPAAVEKVLREHGVSFATSLALGKEFALLDIDCIGRFLAWGAPEAPQEFALAEMAEIKTSTTGEPGCWRGAWLHVSAPSPRCSRALTARGGRPRESRPEQGEGSAGGSLLRACVRVRRHARAAKRPVPACHRHRVRAHARHHRRRCARTRAAPD